MTCARQLLTELTQTPGEKLSEVLCRIEEAAAAVRAATGPESAAATAVWDATAEAGVASMVLDDTFAASAAGSRLSAALQAWADAQDAIAGQGEAGRRERQRAAAQRKAEERGAAILAAFDTAIAEGLPAKAARGPVADAFGMTDEAAKKAIGRARARQKEGQF